MEAARLLLASPRPRALCREVLDVLVPHDQRFCWAAAGDLLRSSTGKCPDPDLADVPFVALDLETTGARPGASKITEIGRGAHRGLPEVGHFHTLVNPQRPIPPMITHITGITQEMVADAPRIEEVIPELLEFLEGAVVVAHNAAVRRRLSQLRAAPPQGAAARGGGHRHPASRSAAGSRACPTTGWARWPRPSAPR